MPNATRATPKTGRVELGLLTCRICDEPMAKSRTSTEQGKAAHLACRRAQPVRAVIANCLWCESPFESVRARDTWTQCCSKSCNVRFQHSKGKSNIPFAERLTDEERKLREFIRGEQARRKRRARLANVARDPYTTASIAERDGGICGLCGDVVDLAIKWPESKSASVDHILPLSRGGDDTLNNIQLAHLDCNLRKRDRV